jgi:hypothetical protein
MLVEKKSLGDALEETMIEAKANIVKEKVEVKVDEVIETKVVAEGVIVTDEKVIVKETVVEEETKEVETVDNKDEVIESNETKVVETETKPVEKLDLDAIVRKAVAEATLALTGKITALETENVKIVKEQKAFGMQGRVHKGSRTDFEIPSVESIYKSRL